MGCVLRTPGLTLLHPVDEELDGADASTAMGKAQAKQPGSLRKNTDINFGEDNCTGHLPRVSLRQDGQEISAGTGKTMSDQQGQAVGC